MATAEPRLTALKVAYKGEIHRIRVDLSRFTVADLNSLFETTFTLAPGSFVVQYKDNENDCLNVTTDSELKEACRVFLNGADEVKSLRFFAISKTQAMFQENVADPILKAIEKLVESLNEAMDKIKKEEWAQKASEKAQDTKVVVSEMYQTTSAAARESFESAKKTINEIEFEKILKEAQDSFESAKKTVNEIQFEQLMKDTAESLKTAAETVSKYTTNLVEEYKTRNSTVAENMETASVSTEEESTTDEETEVVVEVPALVEVVEEPAVVVEQPKVEEPETAETAQQDAEWEEVAETPAVVAPPAVSEEEQKWASQLSVIRDVFPEVDTAVVIGLLEQSRGNVHVVLNALFDN